MRYGAVKKCSKYGQLILAGLTRTGQLRVPSQSCFDWSKKGSTLFRFLLLQHGPFGIIEISLGITKVVCRWIELQDIRQVMAAISEKIKKPHSVQTVELLAARRAVKFRIEIGFRHAIFEGDSEVVIKSIQGNSMLNSLDGHLIKDILSYANSL